MPVIVTQKTVDLKELAEKMPSGTSRSSTSLRRTAVVSIKELQAGFGPGSDLLRQAGIRAVEEFSFDSSRHLFSIQDIQEIVHEELRPTHTDIHDLSLWPEGWNGYNARAPQYEAIQYADHWIELFYQEITDLSLDWLEPTVTASAEGEVVFEWRRGIKNLTIYVGNRSVEYVKDWGADINTEMEDGYANSPGVRQALWKWLMS